MQSTVSRRDLMVWADSGVLAEAESVFSPYEAPIRAIPSACQAKDLPRTRISIVYLSSSEPGKDHESFLECFKSPKADLVVFYMPHHSSALAFQWGQVLGRHRVEKTNFVLDWRHLKQILRAKNIIARAEPNGKEEFDLAGARKRLGLTQEQMAKTLNVAPRTIQNWEGGVGTSQMPKKTQDLRELLDLMDEYVIAPKEHEWLNTPLAAIQNRTPIQAIAEGKIRDLIIEFLRLSEGQPV